MNILFIHQNYPAQYKHIVEWLALTGGHTIVFLTQKQVLPSKTHHIVIYRPDHQADPGFSSYATNFERCCVNGAKVVEVCRNLEGQGFKPDIIVGHSGWGETLFLKELWPEVPVLAYLEYFYTVKGGAVGFDPEFPISEAMPYIMSARNAVNYLSHAAADLGQTATQWQKNGYPKSFHEKIKVMHEGIRTEICVPNPNASATLGRLDRPVTRQDEILTYMARNMEPVRGFHTFMRALPHILEARPNARVLIIGGKDVSYGQQAGPDKSYRGLLEEEVGASIDWSRVHFLGQVPYEIFLAVMQLSRCHVYFTVPFVLSWSLLEAMSMGATVVASNTAPVREVIKDGRNGFLVDFFSPEDLAAKVVEVLAHPTNYRDVGRAARKHIVENYDFHNVCLRKHVRTLNKILPKRLHLEV